jgi:hypothetical protein
MTPWTIRLVIGRVHIKGGNGLFHGSTLCGLLWAVNAVGGLLLLTDMHPSPLLFGQIARYK